MVGGERTTCASTASSLKLRRANARRPLTHSLCLALMRRHLQSSALPTEQPGSTGFETESLAADGALIAPKAGASKF